MGSKRDLNKKARKDDVAESRWLYVDMDPRPNEVVSEERARIMRLIGEFKLMPTLIIDSGNGYQFLFRLSKPLPVDGLGGPLTLAVERRGVALEREFEGSADDCRNIDRILRLPGTINWPTAKKRKKNRVPAPAVLVAHDPEAIYSPDQFAQAMDWNGSGASADVQAVLKGLPEELPKVDVRGLKCLRQRGEEVYNRVVAIVENGSTPEYPFGGDRSRAVWHVTCELVRSGASDEDVVSVLTDRAYRISEHIHDQKSDPIRYAARQVAKAREELGKEITKPLWPDTVPKTSEPRPTYRNTRLAIQTLGITCEHDVFHDRYILGGHAIGGYAGELSDPACSMLRQMIIDSFGFDPGKEHPRHAALQLCIASPRDPVREYIDALVWDGVPRLDTFLTTYLGAEDSSLNRAVGRKMLTAAVRRVRQPGCKFDHMVVLEGEQGSGKSTALRILAGDENFSDQELLSKDERSQQELLQGVLIYEIGELNGMKKADVDKIKAFVTRQSDNTRPAYAHFRVDRPRRCILVGTTNARNYLRDPTGNRRFWPVRTGVIDLVALRRDRDQLWAEAAMVEASGEPLILPSDLIAAMQAQQQIGRIEDLWRDTLELVAGERDMERRCGCRRSTCSPTN